MKILLPQAGCCSKIESAEHFAWHHFEDQTMKRPLLVAAVLAAAPLFASAAKADTVEMFNIVAPTAGVMTFSGTGTANFNQNLGTNNSINLGSSTNVGVNASASSTFDYMSDGFAQLDLDDDSRMQHTIGTATTAFNTATAAESSSRAATVAAFEVANSSTYGSEWSQEWNSEYTYEQGWGYVSETDAQLDVDASNGEGYYKLDASGAIDTSASADYKSTSSWEAESKSSWQAGWENTYETAFTNAYETAVSSATSNAGTTGGTGIISATFNTTETGSGSTSAAGRQAEFRAAAHLAADAAVGVDFASSGYTVEADYNADYEAAYSAAYSEAYAAANATGSRESDSEVSVTGIGSIADINSQGTSTFQADSTLIDGANRAESIGNGNASASASLTSSSYANQSNGTTASAFIQAFSGGAAISDAL